MNSTSNDPWLIVEDLNEQTISHEKIVKNKSKSTGSNKSKEVLDKKGVLHIGYTCLPFTWYNSQSPLAAIFE